MTSLPEYFVRPQRQFYVFEWTGDNLADLQDFIDEFSNNAIHPLVTGASLRCDADGGGYLYFSPGDKMVLQPYNFAYGPISDEELADRFSPIANRP